MAWVSVGLSRDLGAGQAMAAVTEWAELAVWRAESGRVSAWADRCPHRGMRLSHGFVRGETLACIYHGWVYGGTGACARIPAHPDLVVPAAIRAETFAVVEADGVIWVAKDALGTPPDLAGWSGLRSMPFDCSGERLIAALPEVQMLAPGVVASGDLCLVLRPRTGGVMVDVLTRGGDPVAQSRWLEALRWQVEAA